MFPGDDSAVLHSQVDTAAAEIAAVASGIDQTDGVSLYDRRGMVMGAEHEIHSFECLEEGFPLAFHAGVGYIAVLFRIRFQTGPCTDMCGHDDYVRLLTLADLVHIFPGIRDQGLELHPAPQFR